jgi:malate-CoA ligase subunit alpha
LGFEATSQLEEVGAGISTSVGIGGDPINGSSFQDHLEKFESDPATAAVIVIGEIGGLQEIEAAHYCKDHMRKPVLAYVAGLAAPKQTRMGHAGAIISSYGESAAEKVAVLRECGVTIVPDPSSFGDTVRNVLK